RGRVNPAVPQEIAIVRAIVQNVRVCERQLDRVIGREAVQSELVEPVGGRQKVRVVAVNDVPIGLRRGNRGGSGESRVDLRVGGIIREVVSGQVVVGPAPVGWGGV